jgi:hypothetical protein
MSDFPNSTDILFQEESDSNFGAWIKNPTDKFFLYSQGYLTAANLIYASIEESAVYQNTLVYPMIFNYRQFLELRLKELSFIGNRYLGLDKDFKEVHFLKELWNEYKNNILSELEPDLDTALLYNVERLIDEFEAEDPNSMNYRFPHKKLVKGASPSTRKESLSRQTLDLKNFKATIDKLIHFLDIRWEVMDINQAMRDEYLSDMRENYY